MEQSFIHRWQQQSVPHSGVREALLAPLVAPALPDVARSSSASFKNQNSTFINRQFFLYHADGDKRAGRGGPSLPQVLGALFGRGGKLIPLFTQPGDSIFWKSQSLGSVSHWRSRSR